jgi:restriction system protein
MRDHPTINEAILAVMKDAGVPLSAKEAYDRIVAKGLYQFHAQKPDGVVTGLIRRHCKDIDFPTAEPIKYFGMTSDGKFFALGAPVNIKIKVARKEPKPASDTEKVTLASSLRQLKQLHRRHRELIKDRVLRELKRLSPYAFEKFARRLLEVYGFEDMKVTSISNDGGVDGFGKLKVGLAYMNVAFQCKRWTQSNVGRPEIDKFRGAIQGGYEQGIFFTTAGFASGAKEVSIKPGAVPVILIDGPSIVELMIEKSFGVDQESLPVYTYALDVIIGGDEETARV